MLIIALGILALILAYLFYSRFLEHIIRPLHEPTPAVSMSDGVDYVPMSKWKNQLIQLLNIAGTGPIFGALMGAKWGPIVFLWIIFGTILGGAVHDYMSGMMSVRNGGAATSSLITKYLGSWVRYPLLILLIFLMILVAAVFADSASELLVDITGIPFLVWIVAIIIYFIASALLPINKLIGKIYPVFGIMLIVMAVTVIGGLLVGGYSFPSITFDNLHPTGEDYFPDMFITVACGAVSGFHATQSPLVARCLKDEKDGRMVFYGAMALECVIAMVWATAGLAFYASTSDLAQALSSSGSAGVVYEISTTVAGPVGGFLAVVGVIVCPITTGDTAVRSARMMVQEDRGFSTKDRKTSILITLLLTVFVVTLCSLDFTVLWNYMSWLNQSLACVMLWAATVFLLRTTSRRVYSLVTALPALFMTMIVTSFIFASSLGLGLDHSISMAIGGTITAIAFIAYIRAFYRNVEGAAEPEHPI